MDQRVVNSLAPVMDLDLIRSFVTVAEWGGITRAAEKLHRTPGALSQQMKRLEESLDTQLLIREPRQVRLTDDGARLLSLGRQLLKLNNAIRDQFLGPEMEGEVRLGLPDHLGTKVLPTALSRFAHTHPAVSVEVVLDKSMALVERFRTGDLDIVLTSTPFPGVAAQHCTIMSEELVWTGLESGIAHLQTPLPLSVAEHGCAWRDTALEALDRSGIDYRVAYSSDSCAGQEAAMLADLAVAPFPASLVKPPLKRLPEDIGLPPLKKFQVTMYTREQASEASVALSRYINELYPSSQD